MVSDNPETFADLDGHGCTPAATTPPPHGGCSQNANDNGTATGEHQVSKSGTGTPDSTTTNAVGANAQAQAKAQQQGAPAGVVRTGKETDSKPTKMTNDACPEGCTFEGKIYSYQVVDAQGKAVTSSMTVTEHLKRIQGRMAKPATALAPAGHFKDVVGRTAPFRAERSVTDQTFTVKIGNQNYNLSTKIRQTVVVDEKGRVSVSERILVP